MNLFEHEVLISALLRLAQIPIDVNELGLDADTVESRHLGAQGRNRGHLAFAQHKDTLRVRDDRRDVGSDVVLVFAETDNERRVEPGSDQQLRIIGGEHCQRVRAADSSQCGPDSAEEIPLVIRFDQVRDDLGVGVGGELVAGRFQLGLELREVFDDPVVDDEDPAVAIRVRMRVDVGGLAVSSPAGVADPELARRHVGLELVDQGVDLRFGLGHAGQAG